MRGLDWYYCANCSAMADFRPASHSSTTSCNPSTSCYTNIMVISGIILYSIKMSLQTASSISSTNLMAYAEASLSSSITSYSFSLTKSLTTST